MGFSSLFRLLRRCGAPALLAALVLCRATPAAGQAVRSEVLEQDARHTRIAFVVDWPMPLGALVDSVGGGVLSLNRLGALTAELWYAYAAAPLPARALPTLSVVEADFDEAAVSVARADSASAAYFAEPQVHARGLGLERKRPAVTLAVRLFAYEEGALRRYRRIVVDVQHQAAPEAVGKASGLADNPHLSVARSVLADGVVFKIPVTREGMYRLDRAALTAMFNEAGVSLASVQPGQIRLYGNGGEPLPARTDAPRPADLLENPVDVRTSGGALSEVVFYGKAPSGWRYQNGAWEHYVHPFSNENYYFLKIDAPGAAGRRVGAAAYPGATGGPVIEAQTGRHFVDYDDRMWSREEGTGHTWVSNLIDPSQQLAVFTNQQLPGFSGGVVQHQVHVAIASNPVASARFLSGSTVLAEVAAGLTSSSTESPIARDTEARFTQDVPAGAGLNLTMRVQSRPNEPLAALDWIRVFYPMTLRADKGYLRFYALPEPGGAAEFALSGFASEPQVWDVTRPDEIRRLGVSAAGGAYRVVVPTPGEAPRELVAFEDAALLPALADKQKAARVAAQNLHGRAGFPDMVIVLPDTFRVQAEQLAEMRRAEGLSVETARIDHIFNEFSGGLQDPRAMRDYFKFLYDRAPTEESLIQYALLFGDGHFNYRNKGQVELRNWIPPFETEESFDPIESYTSDDYFGLLDDGEGVWEYFSETSISAERVDIGIGRFTVGSAEEASAVVAKIKRYEHPETLGAWRTRYTFLSDDRYNGFSASQDDRDLHVQNSDVVAELLRREFPVLNIQKIYGISYPRVFQGNEWRQPAVRADALAAISRGTLVFNYSGHGNEDELAQERIFTREDARQLDNLDMLPLFVTATCSFGRWDMDNAQSGAEELLLNPQGGAVALMTTVRTVYTWSDTTTLNVGLNYALNRELFTLDADGRPRRLGEALRLTKNTYAGVQHNNRKFNLIGDPSMRLGLPYRRVAIRTVNGVAVAEAAAPLRALDEVTVAGEVLGADGAPDAGFSGAVNLTVFDAERYVGLPVKYHMPTSYYRKREDLIWRGDVRAQAGRFEATFVVPKDISYSDRSGRISAYAYAEGVQATGLTENLVVGGTSSSPAADARGPELRLFLNDTTFVSGGLTTPTPELLVRLYDQSGINTVGAGVGHELLLVVDGDEQGAIDIGSFYQSDENSYQRGSIRFPLSKYLVNRGLERFAPGAHTVEVKAWDVLNNSSALRVDFYVTEAEGLTIRNVLNYPNPTRGETRFVFEHNQAAGTPARVQVRIYSLSGRLVRAIETEEALPEGMLAAGYVQIPWDGRDADLDPLGTGIYLYKVRVEVDDAEGEKQVSEHVEKLAIIR